MDAMAELFAGRFKAAREAVPGLTKYRLAKDAGLAESYVSQIESGKNVPGPKAIAKLSPHLKVSAEEMQAWAAADKLGEQGLIRVRAVMDRSSDADHTEQKPGNHGGFMISASKDAETKARPSIKDSEEVQRKPSLGANLREIPITGLVRLPVFGVVSCGEPAWMPEQALDFIDLPEFFARGVEAAIQVRGTSMIGAGFFEGDYLLVRRLDGERPPSGKKVLACIDGEYTCAVYRSNDLGEYLEKRPPGGETQLYPIKGETRIHALVVRSMRDE